MPNYYRVRFVVLLGPFCLMIFGQLRPGGQIVLFGENGVVIQRSEMVQKWQSSLAVLNGCMSLPSELRLTIYEKMIYSETSSDSDFVTVLKRFVLLEKAFKTKFSQIDGLGDFRDRWDRKVVAVLMQQFRASCELLCEIFISAGWYRGFRVLLANLSIRMDELDVENLYETAIRSKNVVALYILLLSSYEIPLHALVLASESEDDEIKSLFKTSPKIKEEKWQEAQGLVLTS